MTNALPAWVLYLQALTVPVVALFGAWIAYQQWCTARNKLKSDLFDRRFKIYAAADRFLAYILSGPEDAIKYHFAFLSEISESTFLFKPEVTEYLMKLNRTGISYRAALKAQRAAQSQEQHAQHEAVAQKHSDWLIAQVQERKLEAVFRGALQLP